MQDRYQAVLGWRLAECFLNNNELAVGFRAHPPPIRYVETISDWLMWEDTKAAISKFGGYSRAPLCSFSDEFCREEDVRHCPPDEQDVTMVEKSYSHLMVPRKCTMKEWGRIQYLSAIYFELGERMWKEFQDPSLTRSS